MTRSTPLSLAIAVLGAVLAGCSPEPPVPGSAFASTKQVRVDWRVAQHPVAFALGSDQPVPGQLAELDRFLAALPEPEGARIFIDADPAVVGRELAARRVALLQRHLAQHGLSAAPMMRDPAAAPLSPDPRRATVYVGRFVATAPACPDWRKPTAADYTNTTSSNFGCATAVNFSQMLADPGDLLRGREMGPADGERAARAVRRYREGGGNGDQNGGGLPPSLMTGGAGGMP